MNNTAINYREKLKEKAEELIREADEMSELEAAYQAGKIETMANSAMLRGALANLAKE